MAKGSGMIHPNMATMLCFIATDVLTSPDVLHEALRAAIDRTFNMISVDGDTSTNDMVAVLANGLSGTEPLRMGTTAYDDFCQGLSVVCEELAKMIVEDGEGATKMFEVQVVNAPTLADARKVGKAVVASSLVKSAVHGRDPNWGRIMCAAGYSGADVDIGASQLKICSGDACLVLFEDGTPTDYAEEDAKSIMEGDGLIFVIDFKCGDAVAKAWGCDLTNEYVNINAHYRT
jgi:glutamate N-acetyltransferase/amino-acid N-acetyltransferase